MPLNHEPCHPGGGLNIFIFISPQMGWLQVSAISFITTCHTTGSNCFFHSNCYIRQITLPDTSVSTTIPEIPFRSSGIHCEIPLQEFITAGYYFWNTLRDITSGIIIYHDFLPPPRRGSHVKSNNTHTYTNTHTHTHADIKIHP